MRSPSCTTDACAPSRSAHNGNLVNAEELRALVGKPLASSSDSE